MRNRLNFIFGFVLGGLIFGASASVIANNVIEVVPSTQKILIDGLTFAKPIEAYNINGRNYVQLRELAHRVNNFNIEYDELTNTVNVDTAKGYYGEFFSEFWGVLEYHAAYSGIHSTGTLTVMLKEGYDPIEIEKLKKYIGNNAKKDKTLPQKIIYVYRKYSYVELMDAQKKIEERMLEYNITGVGAVMAKNKLMIGLPGKINDDITNKVNGLIPSDIYYFLEDAIARDLR